MKIKHIHSRRVKNDLIKMGNKMRDEERSKINPKFFIYLFEETPKLLKDLTYLTNEINKNK